MPAFIILILIIILIDLEQSRRLDLSRGKQLCLQNGIKSKSLSRQTARTQRHEVFEVPRVGLRSAGGIEDSDARHFQPEQ